MTTLRILLAEIGYRKLNFALSLAAVAVAVALFVAGPLLVEGYGVATQAEVAALQARVSQSTKQVEQAEQAQAAELKRLEDETRKAMLKLGFNLVLVHRDVDPTDYLVTRMPNVDMLEEWVDQLAGDKRLTVVTHLVGALRGRVPFEGREAILVGYRPEAPQAHMHHEKPMGYTIEPGTVVLGNRLAGERKPGDTIEIKGRTFRVAGVLPEQGTDEDGTVLANLSDAQKLLGKPGKVNQILALECRCPADALPAIRRQLSKVLPDTVALRDSSKADARAAQRKLVAEKHQQIIAAHQKSLAERQQALDDTLSRRNRIGRLMQTLAAVVTPLVVLVAAVWVGLLALGNVRERRTEIGILRALGKPSATIAALFLGKAALVGVLGGAAGMALGLGIARWFGAEVLDLGAEAVRPQAVVLLSAVLGAPVVAAAASWLPTLAALMQDPAIVLRET